jgi:hypothetical protein
MGKLPDRSFNERHPNIPPAWLIVRLGPQIALPLGIALMFSHLGIGAVLMGVAVLGAMLILYESL